MKKWRKWESGWRKWRKWIRINEKVDEEMDENFYFILNGLKKSSPRFLKFHLPPSRPVMEILGNPWEILGKSTENTCYQKKYCRPGKKYCRPKRNTVGKIIHIGYWILDIGYGANKYGVYDYMLHQQSYYRKISISSTNFWS